jgi:methylated-DNA-protein-cysteine methyltransferase-like protein
MKPKGKEDFFDHVCRITRLIPYGRVTTYGAIARCLGLTGSARMVGWALNRIHFEQEFIPAHRVVNRNGLLTGAVHFGGTTMEQLLNNEGIEVENQRIVRFKELFWDPAIALTD